MSTGSGSPTGGSARRRGASSPPQSAATSRAIPYHREQVGSVHRRGRLEHLIDDRQDVDERRPGLEPVREQHDPGVVGAEADLVLGEDHPARYLAAELPLLERPGEAGHRRPAGRPRPSRPRRSSRPRRRSAADPRCRRRPGRAGGGRRSGAARPRRRARPRTGRGSVLIGNANFDHRSTSSDETVSRSRDRPSTAPSSRRTHAASPSGPARPELPREAEVVAARARAGRGTRGGASRFAPGRSRTQSPCTASGS